MKSRRGNRTQPPGGRGEASGDRARSFPVEALIVSHAAQGFGAAMLTPASLAMLGATFDEHERSHAIGIWAGAGALTAAAGPVLGGWLVDHVSWRAIFLLNVPLAVAAAGLAMFFACESRDDKAKRLDWMGAITAAIGPRP